jgi:hypothetical protein
MARMTKKLSGVVLAAVVLATAACGTATGGTTAPPAPSWDDPSSAAPSSAPAKPAVPQPTYADLTRGSTTSVVTLYSYDATAHSAVVEPLVFMSGPDYCKKFKVKSTDPRCNREWTTEESHTKVTVPVVEKPKLTTYDGGDEGECAGTMTSGAVCPTTKSAFARWVKDNPDALAVITTKDGTITKIAPMFTP